MSENGNLQILKFIHFIFFVLIENCFNEVYFNTGNKLIIYSFSKKELVLICQMKFCFIRPEF